MDRKLGFGLLVVGLLVLSAGSALAISVLEAQNIARSYVIENESLEIKPIKTISYAAKDYWVVSILPSPNALSSFVPVESRTGEVPTKDSVLRKLFETAYVLRAIKTLQETKEPFISTKKASDMEDLATVLSKQYTNINNAVAEDSELTAEIISSANTLAGKIDAMYQNVKEIAAGIRDAAEKEESFMNKPSVEQFSDLKKAYLDVFSETDKLSAIRLEHESASSDLYSLLVNPDLNITEYKASLYQQYAAVPYKTSAVVEFSGAADSSKTYFMKTFSEAGAMTDLVASLKTRMKMAEARTAIYSEDAEIKEKTDGTYANLEEAAKYMLSTENKWNWVLEDEVVNLADYWQKAESFFGQGEYDLARENAEKAKKSVIKIYAAGKKEQAENVLLTPELVTMLVAALVAILVLLYVTRNWKKIKNSLAPKGREEEEAGRFEFRRRKF